MNYTLSQLQIFLKVTQTKSVTKAAEELHITQPAVSIQLNNFQKQFEIPLTEIVGRKLYVTDFGKEIAESAANIIDQVNAINYKTLAHNGQLTGKLKLSVVSTGKYVMPYFLSDFINSNKGVQLQMDVTNKSSVIKSLEKNEVDFSLVSILPNTINVEKIDLIQNKLYLVGKDNVKLKSKKSLSKFFEEKSLIYREKGSGTRQTMESFLKNNKIPVTRKMQLTSNEAVKQALLAGMGYSFMPLIGIKNEIMNESLRIVELNDTPIKTMWSLIWLKGKKHTQVASAFLKVLEEEKEKIKKNKFDWYEKY
ncbi:MAG: LysR family transcriptional regulator [Ignavibacteria bacterium]|nr:LysR family transcriptional regulator [Ignavibacteria bacterium]